MIILLRQISGFLCGLRCDKVQLPSLIHSFFQPGLGEHITQPGTKQSTFIIKSVNICNNPTHQFSSLIQSCLTLCDPMNCSTPGFPVHHQPLEFAHTHDHRVGDAIQPSHSLASPSPPAFSLSQHQGLFQRVSSSHQVAKVLELQLQHQSFQ